MKTTAPATDWNAALSPTRSHANQRFGKEDPNVRLFVVGTRLIAQSYDGESVLRLAVGPAEEVPKGQGPSRYVKATPLYKTALELKSEGQAMTVEFEEEGVVVRSEEGFEARLEDQGEPGHPTLEIESVLSETFEAEALREVLVGTLYAAGTAKDDPEVQGVYFDLKQRAVVATDMERAAQTPPPEPRPWQGILPQDAAKMLVRTLPEEGDVEASLGERRFAFAWSGGEVRAPLVRREYPRYAQAFPDEVSSTTEVRADALVGACRRMALYAGGDAGRMEITPTPHGNMRLFAEDRMERAEAEETLRTDTHWGADLDFKVGCNPSYLREAAESLPGETLELGFTSDVRPIVLRPVGAGVEDKAVVMPVLPEHETAGA